MFALTKMIVGLFIVATRLRRYFVYKFVESLVFVFFLLQLLYLFEQLLHLLLLLLCVLVKPLLFGMWARSSHEVFMMLVMQFSDPLLVLL